MRFKFSRRTKLIVSTIGISLIVLSGAAFGLAKTGVINLNMLADEIFSKSPGSTVPVNVSSTTQSGASANGQTIRLYQKSAFSLSLGTEIDHKVISGVVTFNLARGSIYDIACDNSPISPALNIMPDANVPSISTSVTCPDLSSPPPSTCGDKTCSAAQTCVTHGGFEGQPVTYSCDDKPTSTQAYLLNGIIKDSSGNPLAGASIEVWDKTNPAAPRSLAKVTSSATYSDGVAPNQKNYQTDIIITSNSATPYANIFLEVTSGGVKMDPVNLGQTGSFVGTKIANGVETDQVKPLAFAPTQTGKIDIQGLIKDDAGNLLAGRNISTGCITTPQTSFDACKLKLNSPNYPYATSTLNPVLSHGTNENYVITNVYDFRNETAFTNITLNVAAPSNQYYYDKNKNGSEDTDEPAGGGAHITIGQAAIQNSQTAGQNAYVVAEDIVFTQIATSSGNSMISGTVYDKNHQPLKNVLVGLGQLSLIEDLSVWAYPSSEKIKSAKWQAYTSSTGKYEITISASDITAVPLVSTKFKSCSLIETFPSPNATDNVACYPLSINVQRGHSYPGTDITFPNYVTPHSNNLYFFGKHTTYDGQMLLNQRIDASYTANGVTKEKTDTTGNSSPNVVTGETDQSFSIAVPLEVDLSDPNIRSNFSAHIKFSKYADQMGSFYADMNNNWQDDDPTTFNFTAADIRTTPDGLYYIEHDQVFKQLFVNHTHGFFRVIGDVHYQGPPVAHVPDATITVYYNDRNSNSLGYERSTKSQDTNISPNKDQIYNYEIDNLYVFDHPDYSIRIQPPAGYSVANVRDYDQPISESLIFSVGLTDNTVVCDYTLKKLADATEAPAIDFPIKFISAVNGSEVSATSLTSSFSYFCLTKANTDAPCLIGTPAVDTSHNELILKIDSSVYLDSRAVEILENSGSLYSVTTNDMDIPPMPTIAEPHQVILIEKNKDNFYCQNIGEIKFCTYAKNKETFFTDERKQNMARAAQIISTLSAQTGVPPFNFFLKEYYNSTTWAPAEESSVPLQGCNMFISISYFDNGYDRNDFVRTLVHEYGHFIDDNVGIAYGDGDRFENHLLNVLARARMSNCNFLGYFSDYSVLADGAGAMEFWAEFFTNWVIDGGSITRNLAAANNDTADNECHNCLAYMYQLVKEQFPNLKMSTFPGNFNSMASPAVNLSSVSTPNLKPIFSVQQAHAAATNSSLTSLGFTDVAMPVYQTVAPLMSMTLTGDQIAAGVWLKQNYAALTVNQKLNIQLNILSTQASNLASNISSTTQAALQAINLKVENILVKLGFYISPTSITGILRDQDGPVKNLMVKFSGKSVLTDAGGKYSIARTKSGTNLPLNVSDPAIDKIYTANNAGARKITIRPNENLSMNISITRSNYTLKGQIYQGANTLNNGKIIIDGIRTVNLDANGKFNFQLKEGQHSLVIKNRNNVKMTATNPGAFGNLGKLRVSKDINSLIWVQ